MCVGDELCVPESYQQPRARCTWEFARSSRKPHPWSLLSGKGRFPHLLELLHLLQSRHGGRTSQPPTGKGILGNAAPRCRAGLARRKRGGQVDGRQAGTLALVDHQFHPFFNSVIVCYIHFF